MAGRGRTIAPQMVFREIKVEDITDIEIGAVMPETGLGRRGRIASDGTLARVRRCDQQPEENYQADSAHLTWENRPRSLTDIIAKGQKRFHLRFIV